MADLLSVPLKKSSDVDIVKPLKNLIQSTYNSEKSSEDFTDALNELSRLRTNAIWKVFEKSSLDLIYSYYDQLVALESKIPPQEVQIPFKWKDAFDKGSLFGGRMSLTISSLAYERMCVLFNMGAMQSAVAAQQPLDTEDSLKLATKLLQQAAGTFAYLKSNIMMAVHQETTPDLSPDTLHALSQLMLAQAQEVIAYKCIRDEMKESMVAKVCAQCEELYTDALRAMQKDNQKPLWDRDWLPTVQAKQAAFRGLAQYYQSLVCRNNKAVGEEIARLQIAVESLKAANARVLVNVLQESCAKAARNLQEATRDNDFIYHERIPDARQLEPISRATVAAPLPPDSRPRSSNTDLFASLVPLAVHQAEQAAQTRAREAAGAGVARLREHTQLLSAALASLGLPAALDACRPGGLPIALRDKAASVRAQGGLPALLRLLRDMPDLLQRNKDILDETERMLREEADSDESLRKQFGTRWSRTPSAQLTESFRANATKYRQIIDNAVRADQIVQQKFQQHKDESIARQEALISRIQTAHTAWTAARGEMGDRDAALGRLCAAHDAYHDLTANLQEGSKFYNDLTQLLVAFQNKVSDFCFARKTEKDELLKDLTQEASRPAPAPPTEPTMVRREAPPRPPPPSTAPSAGPAPSTAPAPAAAALPYPMQPQGMPLPYGAPYQYYAAPMPATYNPYATLPYPHHARMPPPQPYQPYQHAPAQYPQPPPPAGYNPYGPQ
ncbi:hypothetical protein evm_005253 [Chilo suppressalis]|nr:hypothetical protein evm_005253 [Chilo suppressalis]